ncbi:hypothetical protein [Kineococcus aurantiacus]|uniref:Putative damage-inducible protein DinB n=1 Tax=Kineococcus aurantiacus TaxID=37633 RepID=A0A7Y9DPH6_9ACTN|nr:hypothetical protein [Kineococcus aurantiacus]NYD24408.1 putative damage-inducible protein DinB [Kineococcus aurantiacus]
MPAAEERPADEQVHDAAPDSAAEHLRRSRELSQEAREGWEELPAINEADDARHPGSQGQQAPAD